MLCLHAIRTPNARSTPYNPAIYNNPPHATLIAHHGSAPKESQSSTIAAAQEVPASNSMLDSSPKRRSQTCASPSVQARLEGSNTYSVLGMFAQLRSTNMNVPHTTSNSALRSSTNPSSSRRGRRSQGGLPPWNWKSSSLLS